MSASRRLVKVPTLSSNLDINHDRIPPIRPAWLLKLFKHIPSTGSIRLISSHRLSFLVGRGDGALACPRPRKSPVTVPIRQLVAGLAPAAVPSPSPVIPVMVAVSFRTPASSLGMASMPFPRFCPTLAADANCRPGLGSGAAVVPRFCVSNVIRDPNVFHISSRRCRMESLNYSKSTALTEPCAGSVLWT